MSKTLINIITNNTQKVIKSAGVTKKLEFIDEFDNPVPEGIPYHIHITSDKSYWYMTSNEHETNSIVIFRVDGNDSDYVKYRNLVGSKNQKYLSEERTTPTLRDYENGFFTMYFARQANDIDAKIFEISREDFNTKTPFYIKTLVTLRITGEKNSVREDNQKRIFFKDVNMPGLVDIVSPLQYFKEEKNTKEGVQDRLKNYKQVTPSSTSGGSSGGGSYS
tara:strand:- start:2892 stop:3551 length:660 start_codon:yes stop_codon:yes gene_type:complete